MTEIVNLAEVRAQRDADLQAKLGRQGDGPLPDGGRARWLANADIYYGRPGDPLFYITAQDVDDGLTDGERYALLAAQLMRAAGSIQDMASTSPGGRPGKPLAVILVTDEYTRLTTWTDNVKAVDIPTLRALVMTAYNQLVEEHERALSEDPPHVS